jgi:arginyl-tRNA synthetase
MFSFRVSVELLGANVKKKLYTLIESTIKNIYGIAEDEKLSFTVEPAAKPEHGDFATNVAMQLTKILKKPPRVIAQDLIDELSNSDIEKIEIAGPGFINFTISHHALQNWLADLLASDSVLKSSLGEGKKVMVEFVSANPTGPLHIGHGRGASVGDSLSNILEAAGYEVHREYYVNDGGNQMNNLAASIFSRYSEQVGGEYPFPEDGYKGEYIAGIAEEIHKLYGVKLLDMTEADALAVCKKAGIRSILADINKTLGNFGVNIDEYFSEASLYDSGAIEATLGQLRDAGAVFDQDGAQWLATTRMGDEKDRVLKKSDGSYTYLTPDIAYHVNKYNRGHDLLIDVWGADHHGYIKRMQAALGMLGHAADSFDVVLVQMVGLIKGGERLMMSTRAGQFITLDWLIDEVGKDAARFFYIMRSAASMFDFDIDLAKTRSSDNPVYYIQYVHARVASLMNNAKERGIEYQAGNLELLTQPAELQMIKKLMDMCYVIETAATYNEPHRLAYYLQELAGLFHTYYYNNIIVDEGNVPLTNARLSLAEGVAKAVKFGLGLVGVSAPDRM